MSTLRIAGTIPESIVDGPGIRYVLFTQGCPHGCPGCHNPQTHDFAGGKEVQVSDLLADILKRPYVKAVTLSGGEPFCQPAALAELAAALKDKGFHLMCYSGFTFEELLDGANDENFWGELLKYTDFLVDGKFEEDKKHYTLLFKGSENQRIIDVQSSLSGELNIIG